MLGFRSVAGFDSNGAGGGGGETFPVGTGVGTRWGCSREVRGSRWALGQKDRLVWMVGLAVGSRDEARITFDGLLIG